MRDRVGQRADDPQQLDHRPRPAVRDDQRQRALVPRLDVDEVDAEAVDLGLELRQGVQLRLARAPVVPGSPVGHQVLDSRQLHTLRLVSDKLLGRPARRRDTPLKVGQVLVRHVDLERADGGISHRHAALLPDSSPLCRAGRGKDGRTGRAGAHTASPTVTSLTAASRPGNTLTGHWSVPPADRARRERRSHHRAGRRQHRTMTRAPRPTSPSCAPNDYSEP
jgi:hypothetical protein